MSGQNGYLPTGYLTPAQVIRCVALELAVKDLEGALQPRYVIERAVRFEAWLRGPAGESARDSAPHSRCGDCGFVLPSTLHWPHLNKAGQPCHGELVIVHPSAQENEDRRDSFSARRIMDRQRRADGRNEETRPG